MKSLFYTFVILLVASQISIAQTNKKVVHSNTEKTYFIEGNEKHDWYLDPSLDPDVYTLDKHDGTQHLSFYTDIDSLKLQIKPGEQYDFTVIWNGDSCKTSIQSEAPITKYLLLEPAFHDTIPFTLTGKNNLKVSAILNGTDTLALHFDTGASGIALTREAIKNKTTLVERENLPSRDYTRLKQKVSLNIGQNTWEDQATYPVSIAPKETDGHFGWTLFDGMVVEVNYDKGIMIVHSSLSKIPRGYTKVKMEYINSLFCIDGTLKVGKESFTNRYLFDTGYQRAILLDKQLNADDQFPQNLPAIKESILRNGQGDTIFTKIVNGDMFKLGKKKLKDVPTQLLVTDNPARFKTHILGGELIKRYNLILDFQNNFMYLKPNSLKKEKYADQS